MDTHFRFELIRSQAALEASFSLRYQVYCEERRFLPPQAYPLRQESDAYDSRSLHMGAFDAADVIAGTVRLVRGPFERLPLTTRCRIDTDCLPEEALGAAGAEISRLSVSRRYRRRVTDSALPELLLEESAELTGTQRRCRSELVLGLYHCMYRTSKLEGIWYLFAAMEPSLVRLLQRMDFDFRPIGPEADYYGPVTPHLLSIRGLEERLAVCNPEMLAEMARGLPEHLQPSVLRPEPTPDARVPTGADSRHTALAPMSLLVE